MKTYIYKVIVAAIAIILVFKFTIGNELAQINEKINFFSSTDGRKKIVTSIKKKLEKPTKEKTIWTKRKKFY